jgi:hypothetical protein
VKRQPLCALGPDARQLAQLINQPRHWLCESRH